MKNKKVVCDIVYSLIKLPADNVEIDIDDDLKKYGLDSLSFIQMILALEEHYGFSYPDELLYIETVDSMRKIYDIIEKLSEVKSETNFS